MFRPVLLGRTGPYGVVGKGKGGVSAVAACGGGAPPGGNGCVAPPSPPYPPPPQPHGWSRMAITWMRGDTLVAQGMGWARWQWIPGSDHWTQLFFQDP